MSNHLCPKDDIPAFYPKPEVPKGMERHFPFFLDSQTPEFVRSNTMPIVSNLEAMAKDDDDDDVHRLSGFPKCARRTIVDPQKFITDMSGIDSAYRDDPTAENNWPEITTKKHPSSNHHKHNSSRDQNFLVLSLGNAHALGRRRRDQLIQTQHNI